MSKRKRSEKLSLGDIKSKLHLAIGSNRTTAEIAILHLMEKFDFDFKELKHSLTGVTLTSALVNQGSTHTLSEQGLNISFSNVKYIDIAPFIGLDPIRNLGDAPSFTLRRSRIPTALFRDIVGDMDVLLIQYGSMQSHTMEEARSRFLAPVSTLALTTRTTEEIKRPSDLQSTGGSIWLFYPEYARVTHGWPHNNKKQDRVSL